jgi:hypothetical protein
LKFELNELYCEVSIEVALSLLVLLFKVKLSNYIFTEVYYVILEGVIFLIGNLMILFVLWGWY